MKENSFTKLGATRIILIVVLALAGLIVGAAAFLAPETTIILPGLFEQNIASFIS